MRWPRLERKYLYLLLALAAVLTVALNRGFWQTLHRRAELREAEAETDRVDQETTQLRAELQNLHSNPHAYETLVRRELGYLRPGEKEVRIVKGGR